MSSHSFDVGGGKYNDRLIDQVDYLFEMGKYAYNQNINHVFFCGDWFHTHGTVSAEALMATAAVLQRFKELDLQLYIVAGNHDYADKSGFINSLALMQREGVKVFSPGSRVANIKGLPPVLFIPYSESTEYLKQAFKLAPTQSLVFMHQGVSGVEVNSKGFTLNEILHPSMVPDYVLHAFTGHYHTFKRVSDNLTIPGAPMQHNWGDKGEDRGFLEVFLEGSTVHIKRIINKDSPRFVEIDYKETQGLGPGATRLINACVGNFVRVINTPESADIEDTRKLCQEAGAKQVTVDIKLDDEEPLDEKTFESYEDLFNAFVKTQEITGRKLEVGKQIISKNYETPEV